MKIRINDQNLLFWYAYSHQTTEINKNKNYCFFNFHSLQILGKEVDIDHNLHFVGETLKALRKETENKSTLLGFIGSPWTLAAYSIEGKSSKHCLHTKRMMMENPDLFYSYMMKLAHSIGYYACYQAEQGAQVIMLQEMDINIAVFESTFSFLLGL